MCLRAVESANVMDESCLPGNFGIALVLLGNRAANEVAPQFTSRTEWWVSCFFLTRSLLVRSDSRRRVMSHTAFEVLKELETRLTMSLDPRSKGRPGTALAQQ